MAPDMRHVILGTAGHIDHGKSSLVMALTGIDPDRLKEEKERGITIDLGFADLRYDGLTVGIVDVPGHERLIKNMLAGAGGIDLVLFAIAADEGVMPQTREHLAICNLLGIKAGIVAVTKTDLVEPDIVEVVVEEIIDFVAGTFLEGAPIVPVSSKSGHNIDKLKAQIQATALGTVQKSPNGIFRLPIDRVFTLKGFGTVVTGTAVSGTISVDDLVEILPSGIKTRVRGLHSHNQSVKSGSAGQRIAVNLQGVDKDDINRGDVVVHCETIAATDRLDAEIKLLKNAQPLKNRSSVHLHIGTSETTARVILHVVERLKPGMSAFCQLRLKYPIIAMTGDRFIIRRLSPVDTIGGGIILDPAPPARRRKDDTSFFDIYLTRDLPAKLAEKIRGNTLKGIQKQKLYGWVDHDTITIDKAVETLKQKGLITEVNETLFHMIFINKLHDDIIANLRSYHNKNPLHSGMSKEELRGLFKQIDAKMFFKILSSFSETITEKELIRLTDFRPSLTQIDEGIKIKIIETLRASEFQPPSRQDLAAAFSIKEQQVENILKLLAKEGLLVRINDSMYMDKGAYEKMIGIVREFAKGKNEIAVSEFREVMGTTRKYALPFLEYLDGKKITMRVGDKRKILDK
ncbi:MAG: selenocysteine-specific translation elongation factor [Nitrospirae bacterium]|nr:selenocysteine-specific translation elongation factor [Nitrospirota bacterium]